jgi:ATP-grasp domain-containing protein
MKVNIKSDIKLAGIGLVPWTRLGPQYWLENYAIASLHGWDLDGQPGVPAVHALSDETSPLPELPRLNSQSLLGTEAFQQLLDTKLPGYDLLTYKPVQIPAALAGRKFLMNDPRFRDEFENKVRFREQYKPAALFPPYKIHQRKDLHPTREVFGRLLAGRRRIVLQDEALTGGKGTFVIGDFDQYKQALSGLAQLSSRKRVVVSDAIENAAERSIQACVTRHGVITGPLQRQIVAHPLLSRSQGGDKFCGAEIVPEDQGSPAHQQAVAEAERVGKKLAAEGYRGIFGLDFLLDPAGKLFLLEVNPRITGVTPLLTALNENDRGIPFYLLHILELGAYSYTLQDKDADLQSGGSLLVVHSLENRPVRVTASIRSGTYRLENKQLVFVRSDISLQRLKDGEFVLQQYVPTGALVKPGGRLANLQFGRRVVDEEYNSFYNDIVTILETVKKQISTQPV